MKKGNKVKPENTDVTNKDSAAGNKKIADWEIEGLLNEFTEKGRREACTFFMENWSSILKAYPHKELSILGFIQDTITELKSNSVSHSVIKELEQFLREKKVQISDKKPINGKKNNGEKDNVAIIHKTRFTVEGWHYAEFNDNGTLRFLKYKDGVAEVVNSVEIPDPEDPEKKYKVVPAPQIAQTKNDRILQEQTNEVIKFPTKPVDYGTEYTFYSEIKAFLHRYIELRKEDEILLSLYMMKAVLYDALKDSSFPFIHVIAPYGKGKSRLLTVMCETTPYGFYAIDIKSAPLKRVSELYQVILFVDEKGQMDNETSAMINAKYNRNSIVLNANKEIQQGFSSIIGYSIYGPMVLAGREPFNDDAIESKSLQINQDFQLTRTDIPRKIKGNIQDEFLSKGRELRGKLLQFRVNWHDRINNIKPSQFFKAYEDKTEARLYEVISFFEDLIELMPELKSDIQEVLETQIIRNVEVARETPNGIIAETVLSKMDSDEDLVEYAINGKNYRGIYLSAIYSDIGENYKQRAGRILVALGLKTDRPRIECTRKGKNGEEENVKKRYSIVRIPDEKKLNELKARYDPTYIKSILSSILQVPHSTLDEQDEQDEHMENTPPKDSDKKDKKYKKDRILKDGKPKKDVKGRGYSPGNSPNSPNRPASQTEAVNSSAQNEKLSFASVEEAKSKLDAMGFVYTYESSGDPETPDGKKWKVCLKGKMSSFTPEQRERLKAENRFKVYEARENPQVWVHFYVKGSDSQ